MQDKLPNALEMMYGENKKFEELTRLSIEETKAAMKVKKYDYSKQSTLRDQETEFFAQEKDMAKESRKYISATPYLQEDMLDCSSQYLHKRASVITRYTEYVHNKYSSKYPNLCVEDVFMDINVMSNVLTIDYIDKMSLAIFAVALWILDELYSQGNLNKAVPYLPELADDSDAKILSFYDSCHDMELIERLMYLIKNRNIDTNKKKDAGRVFVDSTTLSLKEKRTYELYPLSDTLTMRQRFDSVISLIQLERLEEVTQRFTDTSFAYLELCLDIVNEFRTKEMAICKKRMVSLENQLQQLQKSNKECEDLNSPLRVNNLVKMDDMLTELERKMSFLASSKELLESGSERIKLADLQRQFSVAACMPDVLKMMADDGNMEESVYKKLGAFEVKNPYEILFALFYLFDSGDDIPWLYNQSFFLEKVAVSQLPWAMILKREREYQEDTDESVDADPELALQEQKPDVGEIESELYSKKYDDPALSVNHENTGDESVRLNLSQVLFEHTNVVMPRTVNKDTLDHLAEYGFSEVEAKAVEHCLMFARAFHSKEWESDLLYDYFDDEDDEFDYPDEEEIPEEDVSELKKEIERLKSEVHSLHADRNSYKKKTDVLTTENDELKKEIAELREIIHAASKEDTQVAVKEKIQYPYNLKHRFVVYGGHPTWLKEIKKLLNNIRFIDGNVLPNASLMLNSDAVWIQSNAIGHAFYYKILDVTRTHSIPLEYFTYASAEKCAEQIVEYDRGIDEQTTPGGE